MLVHVTRSDESRSGDLLGVEAESCILRTVLTMRKCSRNSFTGVLVSETLLISVRVSWTCGFGRFGISEVEFCADKILTGLCFGGSSRHVSFQWSLGYVWRREMCG